MPQLAEATPARPAEEFKRDQMAQVPTESLAPPDAVVSSNVDQLVSNGIVNEMPPDHQAINAANLSVQGLIKSCSHFRESYQADPQAAEAAAAQVVEKVQEVNTMRQQGKSDKEIKAALDADDLAWAKSMGKSTEKDAKPEPNKTTESAPAATAKSAATTDTVPNATGAAKTQVGTTKPQKSTKIKETIIPPASPENKNSAQPTKPRRPSPKTAATPKNTTEIIATAPTSPASPKQTILVAKQQSVVRQPVVPNALKASIEASNTRATSNTFKSVESEHSIASSQSLDKEEVAVTRSHDQAVKQLAMSDEIDPVVALRDTIRQLHDLPGNEATDSVSDIAEPPESIRLSPESTDNASTLQESEFPSAEMDNGEVTENMLEVESFKPASELVSPDPDYVFDELTHGETVMKAGTDEVAEVTIGEAIPKLLDSEYATELKSELQDPEAYTGELSDEPQEFENGHEDFTLYLKQTGHEKIAAEAASGVENDSLVPADAPESANVDWDVTAEISAMQTVLEDIETTMKLVPKQTELVQPGSAVAIDAESIMIDQETLKSKLVELLERLQELEVKDRSGNDEHFAAVRETLQQMIDELSLDDENVEYLSKRLGTSEFVLRLRQILTDLQDAAARAYRLGASLLRLYTFRATPSV